MITKEQNKGLQVSFGEGFAAQVSVVPTEVQVGETAHFNAREFDAGSTIKVSVVSPTGQVVVQNDLQVGANQSMGHGAFQWNTSGVEPGNYKFVATGTCRGKEITKAQGFALLAG
jgi:hypothetical protein